MLRKHVLLFPEGAAAAAPPAAAPGTGAAAPEGAQPGAAAPAADTKPPAPKIDAKQLAGFASDFLGKQFGGASGDAPKPEDGKPKPGDAPKPGEGAAPGAAAPAKPKAAKPKKVAPRVEPKAEPPPQLTAEQIAQAAAKGVAEVIKPGVSTPPKTELPPEEARKFSVLQHMEKMYPEKYTGVAEQYKTSMLELQAYADKWEAEHPGETFDETAEEHNAFFERHQIDWVDEDYTEAVADIRTAAALEQERKKSDERVSKLEQSERLRQAVPDIASHQTAGASVFWRNTTKELAGVIKEDGSVDKALLDEAMKKDPVAYRYRVTAANQLNAEVAELYKVMNGLAAFDPKSPVHLALGQFGNEMEQEIMSRPDEDQRDGDGRKFMPATQYWKIPKARRDEFYWTFSTQELYALRAHRLAEKTEKDIADAKKVLADQALAMGWKPPEGYEHAQQTVDGAGGGSPDGRGGKPVSPSAGTDSRMNAASATAGKSSEDFLSSFGKKQLGQS